jgi:hypothetical protein
MSNGMRHRQLVQRDPGLQQQDDISCVSALNQCCLQNGTLLILQACAAGKLSLVENGRVCEVVPAGELSLVPAGHYMNSDDKS